LKNKVSLSWGWFADCLTSFYIY